MLFGSELGVVRPCNRGPVLRAPDSTAIVAVEGRSKEGEQGARASTR
jgi:hypothetical protein